MSVSSRSSSREALLEARQRRRRAAVVEREPVVGVDDVDADRPLEAEEAQVEGIEHGLEPRRGVRCQVLHSRHRRASRPRDERLQDLTPFWDGQTRRWIARAPLATTKNAAAASTIVPPGGRSP